LRNILLVPIPCGMGAGFQRPLPAKSGEERGVGVDPSSPNWAKVDILRDVLDI
jgi:hypothetical protein